MTDKYFSNPNGHGQLIIFGIFSSSATIVAGKAKKSATIISKLFSIKTYFRLSFHVIKGMSS